MSVPHQPVTDFDWESFYQAHDLPWDRGLPSPPLEEWMMANPGRLTGDILVPGCGRGHEVRALAQVARKPGRVYGLDLSSTAIVLAQSFTRRGGERYVIGDFLALTPEMRGQYEWIVEHTFFCAIPPARRPEYVHAARDALKPGGRILAIFYLNPRAKQAGEYVDDDKGPPFGVRRAQLDELFSPHFELEHEQVPRQAFEGREGRELVRVLRRRDG